MDTITVTPVTPSSSLDGVAGDDSVDTNPINLLDASSTQATSAVDAPLSSTVIPDSSPAMAATTVNGTNNAGVGAQLSAASAAAAAAAIAAAMNNSNNNPGDLGVPSSVIGIPNNSGASVPSLSPPASARLLLRTSPPSHHRHHGHGQHSYGQQHPLHAAAAATLLNRIPAPKRIAPLVAAASDQFPVGTIIHIKSSEAVLSKPLLRPYANTQAVITGCPAHPNTWYSVQLHNGNSIKLRSSSFTVGPPSPNRGIGGAPLPSSATATTAVGAAQQNSNGGNATQQTPLPPPPPTTAIASGSTSSGGIVATNVTPTATSVSRSPIAPPAPSLPSPALAALGGTSPSSTSYNPFASLNLYGHTPLAGTGNGSDPTGGLVAQAALAAAAMAPSPLQPPSWLSALPWGMIPTSPYGAATTAAETQLLLTLLQQQHPPMSPMSPNLSYPYSLPPSPSLPPTPIPSSTAAAAAALSGVIPGGGTPGMLDPSLRARPSLTPTVHPSTTAAAIIALQHHQQQAAAAAAAAAAAQATIAMDPHAAVIASQLGLHITPPPSPSPPSMAAAALAAQLLQSSAATGGVTNPVATQAAMTALLSTLPPLSPLPSPIHSPPAITQPPALTNLGTPNSLTIPNGSSSGGNNGASSTVTLRPFAAALQARAAAAANNSNNSNANNNVSPISTTSTSSSPSLPSSLSLPLALPAGLNLLVNASPTASPPPPPQSPSLLVSSPLPPVSSPTSQSSQSSSIFDVPYMASMVRASSKESMGAPAPQTPSSPSLALSFLTRSNGGSSMTGNNAGGMGRGIARSSAPNASTVATPSGMAAGLNTAFFEMMRVATSAPYSPLLPSSIAMSPSSSECEGKGMLSNVATSVRTNSGGGGGGGNNSTNSNANNITSRTAASPPPATIRSHSPPAVSVAPSSVVSSINSGNSTNGGVQVVIPIARKRKEINPYMLHALQLNTAANSGRLTPTMTSSSPRSAVTSFSFNNNTNNSNSSNSSSSGGASSSMIAASSVSDHHAPKVSRAGTPTSQQSSPPTTPRSITHTTTTTTTSSSTSTSSSTTPTRTDQQSASSNGTGSQSS